MQPDRPLGKFLPNPKLKLREQLAEVCRYRHMSHRSENAYWHWIKGFIQFHRGKQGGAHLIRPAATFSPSDAEKEGWRHPREMGAAGGVFLKAQLTHHLSEHPLRPAGAKGISAGDEKIPSPGLGPPSP